MFLCYKPSVNSLECWHDEYSDDRDMTEAGGHEAKASPPAPLLSPGYASEPLPKHKTSHSVCTLPFVNSSVSKITVFMQHVTPASQKIDMRYATTFQHIKHRPNANYSITSQPLASVRC